MIRRPPRSTRTDTLFPYTPLFRSHADLDDPVDPRPIAAHRLADLRDQHQRAAARGVIAGRLVHFAAEPAGDELSVAKRQLPTDMQQPALLGDGHIRSEERRVGHACVSTSRDRGSQFEEKKKTKKK